MPRVTLGDRFPIELRAVVDEKFDGRLNKMATKCGINQPSLSYFAKGERFPSVEMLERLLTPLGVGLQRRLLKAYLADHIPKQLGGLIAFCDPNGRNKENPREPLPLPESTEMALRRLANIAVHSKEVRLMIESTAKVMFGR